MLKMSHLKKALVASAFAGACAFGAPQASAAEQAVDTTVGTVGQATAHHKVKASFDSAALVEGVRKDLKQWGIHTPQVDKSVTDSVDAAVAKADAQVQSAVKQAGYAETQAAPIGKQKEADVWHTTHVKPEPATNPNPIGLHKSAASDAESNPDAPRNFTPKSTDPNYRWRNDVVSKTLAGKPQANYVLHRVPGVWFDAPRTPEKSNKVMTQGKSLYGPGTPIYVGKDTMCTMAVAGYDNAGRKVGLTAGHCGKEGDQVSSADSWQVGPTGTIVSRNEKLDYSVVELGSKAEVTRSYNGVKVNQIAKRGPRSGDVACKRGVATGTTCGVTYTSGKSIQVNHVCATVGDSGAPLLVRGRLVGFVSRGLLPQQINPSCKTPLQGALHSPTVGTNMGAVMADLDRRGGVGAGFRLPRS